MAHRQRGIPAGCLAALAASLSLPVLPAAANEAVTGEPIPELVVTSQRRGQPLLTHPGNIARLDSDVIDRVRHQHIQELVSRASGVWITRASGQEHLTAIRSPVLTGAGSCGAFLFLEDGIPVRPAGFCNVNGLFEIGTEFARSVEVIRGPGNALYGSNALHGTVNVLMPEPGRSRAPGVSLEAGSNDYYRVRAELPLDAAADWLAAAVLADDGGFRDDSGYRQSKLHVKRRWDLANDSLTLAFSASDLDQDTAGYILGEDAYRDPAVNRSNPNPEAFRKASSQRLYGVWQRRVGKAELDVRPYLRHSRMRFLQHFLPGQPVEENGHVSVGAIATATFGTPAARTIVGFDADFADLFLRETQDGPTEGSAFLVETRPSGKHYDYDVTSLELAAYIQTERRIGDRLSLGAGLRADYVHYGYDNRMLTGNTRDDGTECGFGGCLYTRPADRDDGFGNLAPKLSLAVEVGPHMFLYSGLTRGFRAPQATELYRLQNGQQVADLDSERIDSFEVGLRRSGASSFLDISLYTARKRGSIFRDAEGFNISGGRSRHRGVEVSLDWQIDSRWALSAAATWARHTYDFNSVAAQGEVFVSGRDVDTAPRLFGDVELRFNPDGPVDAALALNTIGRYYLDAENRFTYPGHTLASLRIGIDLGDSFGLVLRINNLADRDAADRGDYAFDNYRYFPARGREYFAELRYSSP